MAAPQTQGTTDPAGGLTFAPAQGTQFVSQHKHLGHSRKERTRLEKRCHWSVGDRRLSHVLFNEYDFDRYEIPEIFHHITGARDRGSDFTYAHLRHAYMERFKDGRVVEDNIPVDRPNRFNTTPYTPAELIDFANTRRQIENAASTLGYAISPQVGISLYGVQVDLMHPQTTATQPGVQSTASAPAGPAATATAATQLGTTSNAAGATTGLASAAPPAESPSDSSESDGDPPASKDVQQPPPEPAKYLEMIHRQSLEHSSVVDSFVARSASLSQVFGKSGIHGMSLSSHDAKAYERGGEVLRVHLEASEYTNRFFAHVMVCVAGACTAECSTVKELSTAPKLGTVGEPFVHSVRDCLLTSNGLLTFDPEEYTNLKSFTTTLPEVVHGVTVIFRNTRQQDIPVSTTICRWATCPVCKDLIDEDAIDYWKKLNEESKNTDSDLSATTNESASGQEIDSSCSNALLRPFSIREVRKNCKSMKNKSTSDTSMEDASDTGSEATETEYEEERSAAAVGDSYNHSELYRRRGIDEDYVDDALWNSLKMDSPRTAEARMREMRLRQ